MSEVYKVCQRLKAAGFPQGGPAALVVREDGKMGTALPGGYSVESGIFACPNASECMKFCFEAWGPRSGHGVDYDGHLYLAWVQPTPHDAELEEDEEPVQYTGGAPTDPDQAMRLALAAALEAQR